MKEKQRAGTEKRSSVRLRYFLAGLALLLLASAWDAQTRQEPTRQEPTRQELATLNLTAIVTSAGSLGVVEQFTRDRRILRYAVDRLGARPNARDSLFRPYLAAMVDRGDLDALQVATAIYFAEEHMLPGPGITALVRMRARQILTEATYLRRAALINLREVVQRLSELPGQRLLVMVSDGFTLFGSGGSQDTTDLQSVTSRAVRSGVVIITARATRLRCRNWFKGSGITAPASQSSISSDSTTRRTTMARPTP